MWICIKCGEEVDDVFSECWNCQTKRSPDAKTVRNRTTENGAPKTAVPPPSGPPPRKRIIDRYDDLYRTAALSIKIGNTVKVIGWLVSIIIIIVSVAGGNDGSQSVHSGGIGLVGVFGIIGGLVVGGLIYLLGILIDAQGQLLLAQADVAVYASPFITNFEKAEAMSIGIDGQ